MKNMFYLIIVVLLFGLLFTNSGYSQKIGIVNDDILMKYREDYLKQSKKFISDVANKKNLSAVIHNNGLIWITSDKNKIDITDEVLKYLKSNKNTLPKIEKMKLNAKNVSSIDNVLKSLRKIKAGTEVGINFSLYGEKIVETKEEVSENMPDIPEGDLKNEL